MPKVLNGNTESSAAGAKLVRGRSVLVTGAAGTVGSALTRRLIELQAGEIRALDNNESGLFYLGEEVAKRRVRCILGDVRDRDKLAQACHGVDIVFHSAALKHVPLCEHNPLEAVQTNILGVQNLIGAARESGVKRVIYTSTDKAVNPTNVMGASKLMAERLITAADDANNSRCVFASTRFGNVLDSRGSVIPVFREQIRRGGPITLTDARMTRFVMKLSGAIEFMLEAATVARGGEVFVTKMPAIRIKDLADLMIDEMTKQRRTPARSIQVREIGARPGEKMFEELMNDEETRRTVELQNLFVIGPAIVSKARRIDYPRLISRQVSVPYNSANEKPLSPAALREYLRTADVFDREAGAE